MLKKGLLYLWILLLCFIRVSSFASSIKFTSQELFRVPFGAGREELGARVENGNFTFPRDFTLDGAGHFYIFDSNKHRIARFSSEGTFEIGYKYPATVRQAFAHADSRQNLWLIVSDPGRGIYYGVYDPRGKALREGLFSQFNHFKLHPDDNHTLHVILSSDKRSGSDTFVLDEDTLLMKNEHIGKPPENHHRIHTGGRNYYIDALPGGSKSASEEVNRVSDMNHQKVADIRGAVVYITDQGEVYTRVGDCEIDIYDVDSSLQAKVSLAGLPSVCASVRFDSNGNIYELDGIPDSKGHYNPEMTGMRLLLWARQ